MGAGLATEAPTEPGLYTDAGDWILLNVLGVGTDCGPAGDAATY